MLALAALDNGEEADLGSFIALVVRSASNSVLLIIYYYFPIQNLTIVSIFFKFYCHMITGYSDPFTIPLSGSPMDGSNTWFLDEKNQCLLQCSRSTCLVWKWIRFCYHLGGR
jgi:hypothetical protein